MSWKPELDEIARRKQLADQMGGPERVARHVAAGRLPVRERVDRRDTMDGLAPVEPVVPARHKESGPCLSISIKPTGS